MLVAEAIEIDPEIVSPRTTLEAAAQRMRDKGVRFLLVCKEGSAFGELVGVITDRDIVVRGVAEGRDGIFSRVADVMISPAICCRDSDSLEQAKELALRHGVRRLPVLDRSGRVLGIFCADRSTSEAQTFAAAELPRISA